LSFPCSRVGFLKLFPIFEAIFKSLIGIATSAELDCS
jgi:hypothetical protein